MHVGPSALWETAKCGNLLLDFSKNVMDRFTAMQVFVRVVETESLSAAGRALGLAPSSVSRWLSELEARLGVTLMRRTTRQLSLTQAGEIYFERARAILASVDQAELALTTERTAPSGVLRVNAPASIAARHIAPAVTELHAAHPALDVVLSVTDRMVDLIGEGFDVVLRIGAIADSDLRARKLGEARRIVCASPSYLDRAGRPTRPEQLADHACLTLRRHPGRNLWQFRQRGRDHEVYATGPLVADDGETLLSAATAGMGIVLVPDWLAGPAIVDGRLKEILTGYQPQPAVSPLHALFAPGPHIAPKVRVFIDLLVDRFSRDDVWRAKQR